jgi:NADH-quinone oxidoreductase subunit E
MSVRRLDPVQPEHFAFTPANLVWAKEAIGKYPEGKQASAVIPILWRAQEQIGGWITRPAMEYVAKMLDMSFIRIYEIATFYTMFQLSPVGRKAHVQLCGTTPCMLRGAEDLKEVCKRKIHPEPHHLSADGDFSWEEVECLGACVNAPMVLIWSDTYEDLTPATFERVLDDLAAGRTPKPGPQNGRQFSAPEGGPITLTDPSIYNGGASTDGKGPSAEAPASAPPSKAAKPKTAAEETTPAVASPSPVKTSEAEIARKETRSRAEAGATPEKAPSRVARATKAGATSTAKLPPTRGVEGANPPPDKEPKT